MQKLKDKIKEEPGFQYVVESMELMSAVGRRQLLNTPFISDRAAIESELNNLQRMLSLREQPQYHKDLVELRHMMMCLQDIQGTITHLHHRTILDEVELFEIKNFAHICLTTNAVAARLDIVDMLEIPNLSAIFDLLDPDKTRIPNFYIYDSYHPDLGPIRKELKQIQLDSATDTETQRYNELFDRQNALQNEVIVKLSNQLFDQADLIDLALQRMGYADILQAKAIQAQEWGLHRPTIVENGQSAYTNLFNPRLKNHNEEHHMRYQPIDIFLSSGLTLITGANMAGKTVVLKTLGVAQLMAQFCMFVPAQSAQVSLVDDVLFCIGDEQNEMNGLSSYASEIIKISHALEQTAKGHLLVLIDEPARTTNPIEGKAIVQAISELLNNRKSISLITTHYSQLGLDCRKLRVKGFMESMVDSALTPMNINKYMDYSLVEDSSEEVPHEALRIATILGCDSKMIELAQSKLIGLPHKQC